MDYCSGPSRRLVVHGNSGAKYRYLKILFNLGRIERCVESGRSSKKLEGHSRPLLEPFTFTPTRTLGNFLGMHFWVEFKGVKMLNSGVNSG